MPPRLERTATSTGQVNRSIVRSSLLDAAGCLARSAPRILTAATASLGVACVMFMTACYTYDVKAPTDIMAGQQVEVTVNNIGRVALTADLGDDVSKVDGDFVAVTDSGFRLHVNHVEFLNETATPFPGSEITIPRTGITTVSTKQYSQSKTTVVAVGLAALIIAIIATIGIAGSGNSNGDNKPCNSNCTNIQ